MNLAFELPAEQAKKLRDEAKHLGLTPQELARAAVVNLLGTPDAEFRAVAARILERTRSCTGASPDALSVARTVV